MKVGVKRTKKQSGEFSKKILFDRDDDPNHYPARYEAIKNQARSEFNQIAEP